MFKESWVIYEVLSGSHAYGLSTLESDEDYRGILIPPIEFFLSPFKHIEQYESRNPDRCIFEIRKFIKLAADNNPNVLEILFVDEKFIKTMTKEGKKIRDIRDMFLSAKCKFSYSGYAVSQLKRIKRHRKWLLNPIEIKPQRIDFGLPEKKFLNREQLGYWESLEEDGYIFPNKLIDLFNKEREYSGAVREYKEYQDWKKNRNPKRAELERKYGFDTKHGRHLVRLMIQGREILLTGKLTVDVGGSVEIKKVSNGEWGYDYLVKWAEDFDSELEEIYQSKKYAVPSKSNRKKIEGIIEDMLEERFRQSIKEE